MSTTDATSREARAELSTDRRNTLGLVRRMAVKLTSGAFWQTLGHLLLDNTQEVRGAEVFSGIGFYARPKADHRAEAIVVFPGGAANPIIVATRDEDARKAVAQLGADETAMFNSQTIIVVKGSTVEIRTAGGTAHSLVTLAEFNDHIHVASGSNTTPPSVAASGTTVLKAQ